MYYVMECTICSTAVDSYGQYSDQAMSCTTREIIVRIPVGARSSAIKYC